MIKIKQTKKSTEKGPKQEMTIGQLLQQSKKIIKQNCIGRPSLKRQRCRVGLSV